VDEAHATGVCGPGGRGCVAEAGLAGRVFASVHTCGKALAAAGAFVCGSEALRRFLVNRSRASYSILLCHRTFRASRRGNASGRNCGNRAHARRKSRSYLRNELQGNGFDIAGSDSHLVPIVLGTNDVALAFASRLQAHGFGIRAIRRRCGDGFACACARAKLTANILAMFG